MAKFTQVNYGKNNQCTQIFSSKYEGQVKQYGGGVQIIDGVRRETNNPFPDDLDSTDSEESSSTQYVGRGEIGVQAGRKNATQIVNGGVAFQATHMTINRK
jgi:hypothetical protein